MNFPKQTPFEDFNAETSETDQYMLILHNDDINTFEFVTESLINICDHDLFQAEQCAYLTHYKGKCDIKSGELSELKLFKQALADRGLTVTISKK